MSKRLKLKNNATSKMINDIRNNFTELEELAYKLSEDTLVNFNEMKYRLLNDLKISISSGKFIIG